MDEGGAWLESDGSTPVSPERGGYEIHPALVQVDEAAAWGQLDSRETSTPETDQQRRSRANLVGAVAQAGNVVELESLSDLAASMVDELQQEEPNVDLRFDRELARQGIVVQRAEDGSVSLKRANDIGSITQLEGLLVPCPYCENTGVDRNRALARHWGGNCWVCSGWGSVKLLRGGMLPIRGPFARQPSR